jgi:hypothetical protein
MEPEDGRERLGLCAACRHCRRVESGKGSTFLLCRRSETDPRYPRYPRLPVLQCPGYEPERESR